MISGVLTTTLVLKIETKGMTCRYAVKYEKHIQEHLNFPSSDPQSALLKLDNYAVTRIRKIPLLVEATVHASCKL